MSKICLTEKSVQRQRWIENGLLELMLVNKFENITVTELCRHLSLARRSFYRYFKDLQDVLDSLMEHTFQDFAAPDAMVGIWDLRESFEFWRQRRDLLDALARSDMLSKITEYTLRYTNTESLGKYIAHNPVDMDIREETRLFVICGLVSLIVVWYMEGFQKTPEQMAQIARQMLFSPILTLE